MATHRAANCINGKLAKAYASIDGNVEELLYLKTYEANIEKGKTEVPVLGSFWIQHRAGSLRGSGTMTAYYCSPTFRKLIKRFEDEKRDIYFTLTIINDDPGSNAGIQTVVFNDVNIDSSVAAKFDVDSDVLEEDIPFTFSGIEYISHFNDSLE